MAARAIVAIDASSAVTGGGLTYLREMLPRLAASKIVSVGPVLARTDLEHVRAAVPHDAVVRAGSRTASLGLEWGSAVRSSQATVVFTPTEIAFRGYRIPQVLALRNPMILDPAVTNALPLYLRRRATMQRFAARLARRWSDGYVAVSDYAGAAGERTVGLAGAEVVVIPHGAPRRVAPPRRQRPARRLLFVSSIYRYKGLDLLLESLEQLPEAVSLDVVGDHPDPRYFAEIKALIRRLDLESRVRLWGYLTGDALTERYATADLFVWPSWGETFGHPLLEAHSHGLPIVAADACSNREIAGDAAVWVRPRDVASLGAALRTATAIGQAAMGPTRELDWDECADATAKFLVRIANSPGI